MMKIRDWPTPDNQMACIGGHNWSVSRLFELARDFPVMEVPLDHLCVDSQYGKLFLREMVMHMKATNDADLSKPIILDEDGILMDGRHRIMKAMLTGKKTIKAVRFDENPSPCTIDEK